MLREKRGKSMKHFAYCCECRDDRQYRTKEVPQTYCHPIKREIKSKYKRIACICVECANEVFIPRFHEENVRRIQEAHEICEQS